MSTSIVSFVILLTCTLCVKADYYWRPWTPGQPAKDAITGRDYRGVSYVVEATVPGYGAYISQAFIGQSQINITVLNVSNPAYSLQLTSGSLKVLCSSDPNSLVWYPTSSATLGNELLTASISPVLGGLSANNQLVYIGRYAQYNSIRAVHFGNVISGNNQLLFNHNNVNNRISYYELLILNTRCSD